MDGINEVGVAKLVIIARYRRHVTTVYLRPLLRVGANTGLWTVDWTGPWTGLDYGLDHGLDCGLRRATEPAGGHSNLVII